MNTERIRTTSIILLAVWLILRIISFLFTPLIPLLRTVLGLIFIGAVVFLGYYIYVKQKN